MAEGPLRVQLVPHEEDPGFGSDCEDFVETNAHLKDTPFEKTDVRKIPHEENDLIEKFSEMYAEKLLKGPDVAETLKDEARVERLKEFIIKEEPPLPLKSQIEDGIENLKRETYDQESQLTVTNFRRAAMFAYATKLAEELHQNHLELPPIPPMNQFNINQILRDHFCIDFSNLSKTHIENIFEDHPNFA